MNPVRDKDSYAREAKSIMDNTRHEMRRHLFPQERQRVLALIQRVEFEAALENAERNVGRRRHSHPELYRAAWVAN